MNNHNKNEELFNNFSITSLTKTQKKKILKSDDIEELILFLISAYNCNIFMHKKSEATNDYKSQ